MFNLVNFRSRLKAKQKQILFVLSGLRKRTDRLKRANCPVMVEARSNEDGSWTITKAVLEHKGHEVSEELYRQYLKRSKARKLTSEQEDAVLSFLIKVALISYFFPDENFSTASNKLMQGGKLPEVAKMLSDFTDGILNGRFDVYNVVNRLKKKNMVVNIETGQKMVEFKGVQVPAEGLGLTQFQKNSGKIVDQRNYSATKKSHPTRLKQKKQKQKNSNKLLKYSKK